MLAVAVLDEGISNAFNRDVRPTLFERDYLASDSETDTGIARSHGAIVADAVLRTDPALDLIDARVAAGTVTPATVEAALQDMIALADQGWRIGAINCSFAGLESWFSAPFVDEIAALAQRGILLVAASGNFGLRGTLEKTEYPAALPDVIAVGSHDGTGMPSDFAEQGLGRIAVLADGEDYPGKGESGTSFSTPQVAATVAAVQGLMLAATDRTLGAEAMVDVLRQGGAGPLSKPDPADGVTRYALHDHGGALAYAFRTHVAPRFEPLEYLASHADLQRAFGTDAAAATAHLRAFGAYEGRETSFDALAYVASHADLHAAFGTDRKAAARHWFDFGLSEGREVTFDAAAYFAANPDVAVAHGGVLRAAAEHYLTNGIAEHRPLAPSADVVALGMTVPAPDALLA